MLQPELKLRRDKIRSLMVSQGIDAALITCNANLIYTYGCVVSGYLYLPLHSPALLFSSGQQYHRRTLVPHPQAGTDRRYSERKRSAFAH